MHDSPEDGPVELRLLQSLVVVAEEGGVSAAAERLRIAQPSLSRQLRLLEKQLGLVLFERVGRRLRVVPAADVIVEAARRALQAADDVSRLARQVADGRIGRVAVATLPGASPVVLVDALAAFRRRHPGVETTLTELTDEEQYRALREGRVDLALARIVTPPADLASRVLLHERLCLVVSTGHRLADAEQVRLADLRGEEVVFFSRSVQPVGYRWLTEQLADAGIAAPIQEATLATIFATVAAGIAVSVLVRSFEDLLSPAGVRFVPLDGPGIDLVLHWRPACASPSPPTSAPNSPAPPPPTTATTPTPEPPPPPRCAEQM
ncbi:LysR family transcriptional regulator [Streptacidiphilus sp. PB12-B1b]|uniref:LysR substrate-binding domain-containing protein n=1 Tax=Streptacidiphilus sp. PB12-B1b TaxID=2705012 RepID=UPI0015F9B492|nr:LysR family transcriptional regulator [Streptacidiphilus sp. PB12-B1b]QMU78024.1 LysR family transcriptional regulator [Streptacidiphilus sp. PB12-B1b]